MKAVITNINTELANQSQVFIQFIGATRRFGLSSLVGCYVGLFLGSNPG